MSALIRQLPSRHRLYTYLLGGIQFPLKGDDRIAYVELLQRLLTALDARYPGPRETLLQFWMLHYDAASKQLSKNGRDWQPLFGLGVWPNRPPPAVWTVEEFEATVPGEFPRPPVVMLVRLKGAPPALANVPPLMGGRGALLYCGIAGDPEQHYRACEDYFQTFIEEPLQKAYPFHFPLIEGSTLAAIGEDVAGILFGRVRYYVRESAEDNGLLLISPDPLDAVFRQLGWRLEQGADT